ncbi:MAG TPA: polysaccharide deacetylase family protein [Gemmatimonadaceae bacterium]|nr:polysaccharide deacetylase family protein [Gemmatimonadaceae bacterium]
MRVFALQYHDVIEPGAADASGAPGEDAATYKLPRALFEAHVSAVSRVARAGPPVLPPSDGERTADGVVLFTFDDGGVSAATATAGILERHAWRGIFLVTTDWIGRRGFLDEGQLRELDARGHVIGAHSCSHPLRFSRCTPEQMRAEWRGSVRRLEDVLGHAVQVASVPGGYYSRAAAVTAAEAGIRTLFTSEPVARTERIDGCVVVGRFTLRAWSSPAVAAALAAGRPAPRAAQWLVWNSKKAVKSVWGDGYLRLRGQLLGGA